MTPPCLQKKAALVAATKNPVPFNLSLQGKPDKTATRPSNRGAVAFTFSKRPVRAPIEASMRLPSRSCCQWRPFRCKGWSQRRPRRKSDTADEAHQPSNPGPPPCTSDPKRKAPKVHRARATCKHSWMGLALGTRRSQRASLRKSGTLGGCRPPCTRGHQLPGNSCPRSRGSWARWQTRRPARQDN